MSKETQALDLIVRGGCVVDGTRAPRYDADIGIAGDRIVVIGDLSGRHAAREIDARGRIVAPGFIDAHTHDDQALLSDPAMDFKVSQGVTTVEPAQFREAVAAMNAAGVRPEIELGPIRPPQRLAPFSYALGAEVKRDESTVLADGPGAPGAAGLSDAFGRLILLHDPDGADAWDGTMRLVAFIQADLDSHEAVDPLLPEVAWSWLVEALESRSDEVTALGGTVTATSSVRYGDISGPPRAHQLELRASWTATTLALGPHVQAFCEVLEHAAGLPPVGVTDLSTRSRA